MSPEVHIDLGHVGIYRGLARAAGLSGEAEQQLFDALQRKAIDEVAALIARAAGRAGAVLRALAELCGGREVLARRAPVGRCAGEVLAALDELVELASLLTRAIRRCRCISI